MYSVVDTNETFFFLVDKKSKFLVFYFDVLFRKNSLLVCVGLPKFKSNKIYCEVVFFLICFKLLLLMCNKSMK